MLPVQANGVAAGSPRALLLTYCTGSRCGPCLPRYIMCPVSSYSILTGRCPVMPDQQILACRYPFSVSASASSSIGTQLSLLLMIKEQHSLT